MIKNKDKKIFLFICYILIASILAILVHSLMPGGDSEIETNFDSFLVKIVGFPAVATSYFIILYTQILVVVRYYQNRSPLPIKSIGLRFGIIFGLIYLIGMQEVILSASPYQTYGLDFILYQLSIGLGDAIPAFILCYFISKNKQDKKKNDLIKNDCLKKRIFIGSFISIFVIIQRLVGFFTEYLDSDINTLFVPTLIWTIIFGIIFGLAFIILEPIYRFSTDKKKGIHILLITIGINWIWFNLFIGLIFKGMFISMFFRGGLDIIAALLAYYISIKIYKNND